MKPEEIIDKKIITYVNNIVNLLEIPVENSKTKPNQTNHWILTIDDEMINSHDNQIEFKSHKSNTDIDTIQLEDKVVLITQSTGNLKYIISITEIKDNEDFLLYMGYIVKSWGNIKIDDLIKNVDISSELKEDIQKLKENHE